ncbi:hypothetical protein JB92DRAFT_2923303, partial [Gautieria morchelliformis]
MRSRKVLLNHCVLCSIAILAILSSHLKGYKSGRKMASRTDSSGGRYGGRGSIWQAWARLAKLPPNIAANLKRVEQRPPS